jgi:hypothetical protein
MFENVVVRTCNYKISFPIFFGHVPVGQIVSFSVGFGAMLRLLFKLALLSRRSQ